MKSPDLFKRRIQQLKYLITTKDFDSIDNLNRAIESRYSHPEEIEFYKKVSREGPNPYEKIVFPKILDQLTRKDSLLVIGCGGGKECFYFNKYFQNIIGIDSSKTMIETADQIKKEKGINNIFFFENDVFFKKCINKKFDFIYLTIGLPAHIPEQRARIEFFKKLKNLLSKNGKIFMYTDIDQFSFFDYRYWLQYFLRYKFYISSIDFSRGDTLRAYLGDHTSVNLPIFYHYYPSQECARKELTMSNLKGHYLYGNSWIGS